MRPRTCLVLSAVLLFATIIIAAVWTVRSYLPALGLMILFFIMFLLCTSAVTATAVALRIVLEHRKVDVGQFGSVFIRYGRLTPIGPMREHEIVQMIEGKAFAPDIPQYDDYDEPEDITITEELDNDRLNPAARKQIAQPDSVPLEGDGDAALLERARAAFREGHRGRGSLSKHLDINPYQAAKLLKQLKERGMIE